MKRILITGKNSYIGNSFANWCAQYPDKYLIDFIDMRTDDWKDADFSMYDVVFHVAGIAHISSNPKMKDLYYKVNTNLTIEVAKYAKKAGVRQFIFMSSIIVYGDSTSNKRAINRNTVPTPSNFYGDSKLKAEQGIQELETDEFKIVILRPPMIYGKGSKGNYPKLAKAARMLPLFPDKDNQRSMLHIDNLCEFIRLMIENKESGLFFPQNKEYVKTSEMVKLIALTHGKEIRLIRWMNWLVRMMSSVDVVNKVFGNFIYEQSMSDYQQANYQIRGFKESIELTEK